MTAAPQPGQGTKKRPQIAAIFDLTHKREGPALPFVAVEKLRFSNSLSIETTLALIK